MATKGAHHTCKTVVGAAHTPLYSRHATRTPVLPSCFCALRCGAVLYISVVAPSCVVRMVLLVCFMVSCWSCWCSRVPWVAVNAVGGGGGGSV
jgi:hypothetical protein